MNLLLLLDRVPAADECARTCVDSAWLLELGALHDLVVAVDEASPSLSELRDADITVHVSDKRHVYMPGDRMADADETLAGWVVAHHEERPFDLMVSTPERGLTGAVHEALPGVPRAVLAAAGPCASVQRLSMEPQWLDTHGHELWFAASAVTGADVALSPVPLSALGLETRHAPVRTLLPVPEPDLSDRVTGELVVVAATGVSRADAAEKLEAAITAVDVGIDTTIIVLHAAGIAGADDIDRFLAAGVPDQLAEQVVFVPTGREGEAGAWLAAADALVLADSSELLIPSVARRAALVPTVVPGPRRAGAIRTAELQTGAPRSAAPARRQLLQWTTPDQVAANLHNLRWNSDVDVVIIHDEEAVAEAARWLDLAAMSRFDVVLSADERLPWGMPHLGRLDGGVLALHRRTWTAVAAELRSTPGLHGLVAHLADLTGARSHTLGVVTMQQEVTSRLAPARSRRSLTLTGGPLRDLRLPAPEPAPPTRSPARTTSAVSASTDGDRALRSWARSTNWPQRARLALPWKFGLADAIEDDEFPDGVVAWARRHGIADRARLLLPWRWGLLPRAMEGRW